MTNLIWGLPVLFAIMDRVGGNGYKWVRRFGIPIIVFLVNPTIGQVGLSILMGSVYSFNLDEIEDRDYESIFTHGCGVALGVSLLGGAWVILIPVIWTLLTACSLRWNRLDWKYVEITRGFVTGLCCLIG